MFVIYENATSNDEPMLKEFVFAEKCVSVKYNGRTYSDVQMLRIPVKKRGKVYATAQPASINNYVIANKGQRK